MRNVMALLCALLITTSAKASILTENQMRIVVPDDNNAPYSSSGPYRPIAQEIFYGS